VFLSTVDETFDTGFKMCFAKIQQISEVQVRQPDIGQNLLDMDRKQGFDRFQFE
jgi:hypothetical protein